MNLDCPPMNLHASRRLSTPIRRSGFSLIELMVVIAIIALLAGLIAYLLPGISQKKVRGRARVELKNYVEAINRYKLKKGFFPPDNPNATDRSSLYYELTATDVVPAVTNVLGVTGILNAG